MIPGDTRDTQTMLGHALLNNEPPQTIMVAQRFLDELTQGPYTDVFGLVWEMTTYGYVKCGGTVWKVDLNHPSDSNHGPHYRATWPD